MDDKKRAELRRIRKLEAQAGVTQQEREQVAEASRAVQPAIDARSDQALEAAEASERFRYVMGQVKAAYSEELRQTMARVAQLVNAAAAAQVEQLNRQVQDALAGAGYDAQFVEMSRQIQRAVAAQIASGRIPRAEIFRPTLDRVMSQIEIPYHSPPTLAPAGRPAAPGTPPSVPDPEQDLAYQIAVDVLKAVITAILVSAILTYAQTGLWVFEELLAYFVALVQQLG